MFCFVIEELDALKYFNFVIKVLKAVQINTVVTKMIKARAKMLKRKN
jgi:hypothetical protein